MNFSRLTSDMNEEHIQESDQLIVPGNPLFQRDYLCKWLQSNSTSDELSVNPTLLYNKYPWWFKADTSGFSLEKKFSGIRMKNGQPRSYSVSHQYKNEVLDAVAELSMFPPADYEQIRDRHYLAPDGLDSTLVNLRTKTRLVIGLSGADSVLEVGITMHPYYGFPFIPGSCIKGLTRHFCAEYEGWSQQKLIGVFGGKDETTDGDLEGDVVFYDAWPEKYPAKGFMLERDVMTIHYQEYYNEKGPPADNSGVVPVNFLAVAKGVIFVFGLRPSSKCRDKR
ncbi:MAG: type III-B CRISPR module RAMP protein Cmr6, partial [Archaeoglobales archaeon]|nr:type III-B CRISPR module RAMP protein Cmr6 [Archaeoglobales archaeon]